MLERMGDEGGWRSDIIAGVYMIFGMEAETNSKWRKEACMARTIKLILYPHVNRRRSLTLEMEQNFAVIQWHAIVLNVFSRKRSAHTRVDVDH